jgi:hypothetical protein
MANLVKIAEELEYVPKPQLVEMARSSDHRFPIYMVLSEIQRRTHMEKIYNAAQFEQPRQTVAEERVNEFEQSQGLAGAGADQLALANTPPTELAPASPMQEVAGGGRIRYQTGGYTDLPDTNVDPYGNVVTAGIPGLSDEERRRREQLIGASIVDSSLIQAESGGNPDALLGHSQDDFGWYPSNQTIGENIEFANPDGDYAAFSREYLGGENYSTPMGLYQITGTTLQDIVDRFGDDIGVDLDTPFTPDVQQRLADAYLSGHVIKEDQTPEERREAFRRAWAAADNFSDDQIDTLIASMSERDLRRRAGEAYSSARGVTLDEDSSWERFLDSSRQYADETYGSSGPPEWAELRSEGRPGESWLSRRYKDDDGTVDWSNVLFDASWLVPGLGAAGLGLRSLKHATPVIQKALRDKAFPGLRGLWSRRAGDHYVSKAGNRIPIHSWQGQSMRTGSTAHNPLMRLLDPSRYLKGPGATRTFAPGRAAASLAGAGVLGMGGASLHEMLYDNESIHDPKGSKGPDKEPEIELPREGDVKSVLDQAEGLDIARLGGIIMGAKNMSELGTGIAGLAEGIQERRAAEKLSTAQMGLLEAQTAKYESEVANLEKTELMQLMNVLQDLIRDADGIQRPELIAQFSAALNRYNQLTGGGVDGIEDDRRMEAFATFGEEPPGAGEQTIQEETEDGLWKRFRDSSKQYAGETYGQALPY